MDGDTTSLSEVRGCRNLIAARDRDGAVDLYRPYPRFRGEALGTYRLRFEGSALVWRWQRATDVPAEAWRR